MFNKLKNLFKKPEPVVKEKKPRKPRKPKAVTPPPEISEKDRATAAGEPYIKIVDLDVDPSNINTGSMTFDWNDKFILNLIKSGYKNKEEDTDDVIVDRWFQTVCRNIALEVYEQQAADSSNAAYDDVRSIQSRNLGDGRTEVR